MFRKQDVSRTLVHNCLRQIRAALPQPERRGSSSSGSAAANVRGSGDQASDAGIELRMQNLNVWQPAWKFNYVWACLFDSVGPNVIQTFDYQGLPVMVYCLVV